MLAVCDGGDVVPDSIIFYTFGLNIIFVLSAFILHIIFMILFITIFTAQVSFSIHHVKMRY